MSWYFFGGFSAYWIDPSGRSRNHSGCLRGVGVVRARTGRRCPARSRARARRRRRRGAETPRACRAPDGSPCDRLRRRRSPTGCRGRPGRRSCCCWVPCGSSARSGGSAAGRATSKPIAAISGRRASTSANVPWRPASVAAERGKSSYHAPKRASSRSTTTASSASNRVAKRRSAWACISEASSADAAACPASLPPARIVAESAVRRAASAPVARAAAVSTRPAPIRGRGDVLAGRDPVGRGRGPTCRSGRSRRRRCTGSGRARRRRRTPASGR